MTELPAWAHCETDEEEAKRVGAIFRRSEKVGAIVGLETIIHIKGVLNATPKWRLYKRWRLVRVAKSVAEEHGLVA